MLHAEYHRLAHFPLFFFFLLMLQHLHKHAHSDSEGHVTHPCCSWPVFFCLRGLGPVEKRSLSSCLWYDVYLPADLSARHSHSHKPGLLICCCKVICPPFLSRWLPWERTGHEIIMKREKSGWGDGEKLEGGRGETYLSCAGRKIWERLARSKQTGYVTQFSCVEVCWKEKQWQKKDERCPLP